MPHRSIVLVDGFAYYALRYEGQSTNQLDEDRIRFDSIRSQGLIEYTTNHRQPCCAMLHTLDRLLAVPRGIVGSLVRTMVFHA